MQEKTSEVQLEFFSSLEFPLGSSSPIYSVTGFAIPVTTGYTVDWHEDE